MTQDVDLIKKALIEVKSLKRRIAELEYRNVEPIAIVGMSCRFPGGVTDPESFWNLLIKKKDPHSTIPKDSWNWERYFSEDPDVPGTAYTKHGYFLDRIDTFDNDFFGISPSQLNPPSRS